MHAFSVTRRWAIGVTASAWLTTAGATVDAQVNLDLDIPVRPIAGAFTLNGETPPSSLYENGRVYLRNPRSGDEVRLGDTRFGTYTSNVIPGNYQIYYERLLGGSIVPKNKNAYIGDVTIPPPSEVVTTHNIDIPFVSVSGTITLNGDSPPGLLYENGRILAVDTRTEDEIVLGYTALGGFSNVLLVPGRYDIFYDRLLGGNVVPRNERALLSSIDLANPTDLGRLQVPVPEPSTYALALLSALWLGVIWRRRRNVDLPPSDESRT